jgi:hypothetical protein
MIIEGKPAGNVGFWSKHLQRADTNEAVHIRDVRGTMAQDVEGALREMEAVASGSRSHGNFMYQANINPYAHEHLTPEQWREAIDTLEKNLGLEDHQRVVVEHVKAGRQHYHVIWNRVDVDTMRVRDMGGNFYTHERTARDLEEKFGLERTPRAHGEREGERVSKRTDLWEHDRGHETGQNPHDIKAELTTLWQAAGNGRVFVEALERYGYILAKGDKRDFCVIDRAGDEHSLARRLDGVTAKQLRARLSFIDRDALPTVAEAKELFEARRVERQAEQHHARQDSAEQREERFEAQDRTAETAQRPTEDQAQARSTDKTSENPRTEQPREEVRDDEARHDEARTAGAANQSSGEGIRVFDGVAKVFCGLADFIGDLLASFVAPPQPKRTAFEQMDQDPADRVNDIRARRRAEAALENIADDLERGNTVKAEDVRNLAPADLQNIRDTGDAALLAMVRQLEEERERERDRGRTRGL